MKSNKKISFESGKIIVAIAKEFDFADCHFNVEIEKVEIIFNKATETLNIVLVYLKDKSRNAVIDAIKKISDNICVAWVEPDYVLDTYILPNDRYFEYLWGLTGIGAENIWNSTTGSDRTVIGIIDSGIDYNHPDLAGNILAAVDFHGNNPMDFTGHGTHVAGTIGAVGNNVIGVCGVCWKIGLASFKIGNAAFELAAAIKAINYANENSISILNASWGIEVYSPSLKYAIDNYDGLFVAASGNSGRNIDEFPVYPASFNNENIITVGASDRNNTIARFSNYGKESVDILAPGVNILSTDRGNTYTYMSGTSMAAPFISGVGGLLKGLFPTISTVELKQRILSSVSVKSYLADKTSASGILSLYNQ